MIPTTLPEPDSDARRHSDRLLAGLRGEIRSSGGCIPFSRYMELALYTPGLGYYSAGATKFGRDGDFVTAPELGSLFAGCVAEAVAPVLAQCGDAPCFFELGGGSGALAADLLDELLVLGSLPAQYLILEPSADLRQRQRERLQQRLAPDLFARLRWLDALPEAPFDGVLFANEVLDALPTTRFAMHDGEVMEEHVGLRDDDLTIVDRPADALVAGAVRHVERSLGRALPDGYRSELLPQLPYWLDAVTGSLRRGLALFIDYGYPRAEFYLPERSNGTLLCHYRHRVHDAPFHLPGLQDITASVDFTALAEAGVHCGFELAGFCSQAGFLLQHGIQQRVDAADDDIARHRRATEAKRLLLPSEMGERFLVMGLTRDLDAEAAFELGDQRHRL